MSQVLESMTRVVTAKYTVRVWRNEELDYQCGPNLNTDIEEVALKNEGDSPTQLAKRIAELPRVAAVEVLGWDESGYNGVVYYPNWS
jgi:hypothetical protein